MSSIPPNASGIYKITCTPTGKIYIGSAKNLRKRWHGHCWALNAKRHPNTYLQHAWDRYGADAFTFDILELVMFPEYLTEREQHYLDALHPYDMTIGFNLTRGAGSTLGRNHSPETRRKLSERAQQRTPASAETRQKISEANRGQKRTPEQRQKLSEALKRRPPESEESRRKRATKMRGRKLTPEHRQKVSAAGRGRKATDKARQNMKIAQQNRPPITDETRQKMRTAQQNRSPEWHQRMSEGQKRRDKATFFPLADTMKERPREKRHIITTPKGEELFVHLSSFCKEHDLTYRCMINVLQGKQRAHKGYTVRWATTPPSKRKKA